MNLLKQASLYILLLFIGTANSMDLIDPRIAEEIGQSLGRGMARGAGEALKENMGTIPKEVVGELAKGAVEGMVDGIKHFAQKVGPAMQQEYGQNSQWSHNLQDVTHAAGKNLSTFFDGVGDRLFPFMLKYWATAATGIFLTTTGYYGTKVAWNVIQHKLLNPKPKIIIDSSKKIGIFTKLKYWILGKPQLPPMVFSPLLQDRLARLTLITQNISEKIRAGKTNIFYRNLLLYGPPGTGKTMFALQLAKKSGMEFVMVTGSSFLQPGAGIAAIDELFRWALKTKKGLCIFIDEADSLLCSRNAMDPSSENYRVVNHFLNYLGERTNKFMVVLATNYPIVFDKAMQRRIDDAVEMPLPGLEERTQTLQLYRNTLLCDEKQNGISFVKATKKYLDDDVIHTIAHQSEGFSYSDLQGIIMNIKTSADISKTGLPDPELIQQVVQDYLAKKQAFKSE